MKCQEDRAGTYGSIQMHTPRRRPITYGNPGRNTLRGPGLFTADWSLQKAFAITENKSLTFRWETFNLFNRTNLGIPNGAVDAGPGSAGVITSLGNPMRQMQFGLHFVF